MKDFIKVNNLHQNYVMGDSVIHALDGVSFAFDSGDIICILGTSGSGKSTLLNALAGLEKPSSGEIIIGGIHLEKLNERQLTKFRQLNIGFVFQSYNLIPSLTALENVSLGLIFKGMSKKDADEISKEMLDKVGLSKRLNHKPNELSGGQQQRVSIARAFVDYPKVVFADEPTGNLDSNTSIEIMELMTNMALENGQTLMIVTHDELNTNYCNKVLHIKDGKIDKIIKKEFNYEQM